MFVIMAMSGITSSATSFISPTYLAPSSEMKTSVPLSSSLLITFDIPIGVLKELGVAYVLRLFFTMSFKTSFVDVLP